MRARFPKASQAANVAVGLLLAASPSASPLSLDATDLAKSLAGRGVAILEATLFLTSPKQAGLFTKPKNRTDGIGFTSGVVLSSAWATEEAGKNDNVYLPGSDDVKGDGYHAFDKMLPAGIVSKDACILQIMFTCSEVVRPTVSFDFVYGTEEYPWPSTGSGNKDIMGAFLEGEEPEHNIVLLYGQELTRSNSTKVSATFKSNIIPLYRTEMNGFTTPMTASAAGVWGSSVNVLHIAVADTGTNLGPFTHYNGAWLFIKAGSLQCSSNYQPGPDDDFFADDFPTVSPYPTPLFRSPPHPPFPHSRPPIEPHPRPTYRPTYVSRTMEPSLEPTTGTRKPTARSNCADMVWDECPRCGDRTCYDRIINRLCHVDPYISFYTYRRNVLKTFRNRYCPS